jgi:hypothetical protein
MSYSLFAVPLLATTTDVAFEQPLQDGTQVAGAVSAVSFYAHADDNAAVQLTQVSGNRVQCFVLWYPNLTASRETCADAIATGRYQLSAGFHTVVAYHPDLQPGTFNLNISCSSGTCASQKNPIFQSHLPAANEGKLYSHQLTARGFRDPITWTITSGALPPGITLGPGGFISGTTNTRGIFPLTIRAEDASRVVALKSLTFVVSARTHIFRAVSTNCGTIYKNNDVVIGGCGFGPTRGFQIAIFDLDTGQVLDIRRFDPWQNPNEFDALREYIEKAPRGLLLAATADDIGFQRSGESKERLIKKFEELNSRYLKLYAFRDSWVFAAINDGATWRALGEDFQANWQLAEVSVTLAAPKPAITQITPDEALVGRDHIDIRINGSNFTPESRVRINGHQSRVPTYVDDGALFLRLGAADLTARGTLHVDVENPGPVGGTSQAQPFYIRGTPAQSYALKVVNGQYVYISQRPFALPEVTIEVWAKLESATLGALWGNFGGPWPRPRGILLTGSINQACLTVADASRNSWQTCVERDLKLKWFHFAGTWERSSGKMRFYIDGELVGEKQSGFLSPTISAAGRSFAELYPAPFTGRIDELRIWSHARTQDEIRSTMYRPLRGNETGLVGYWPLDQGTGQVVLDRSNSAVAGQLGSTAAVDAYDPAWFVSDVNIAEAPTAALELLTRGLPDAVANQSYDYRLVAIGGDHPHGWRILRGTLPKGLELSKEGRITGQTEATGLYPLEVEVVDASGQRRRAALDLDVARVLMVANRNSAVVALGAPASGVLQGGAVVLRVEAGKRLPAAAAVFSLSKDGVLVSETGVPGMTPLSDARLFVVNDAKSTSGLALANFSKSTADIRLELYDSNGVLIRSTDLVLPSYRHTAFLIDAPPLFAPHVEGTIRVKSSQPVGIVGLRASLTTGTFLMTTAPVYDANAFSSEPYAVLPHFADGGGWTTEIVLVNPSSRQVQGTVQFLSADSGTLFPISVKGRIHHEIAYALPANGSLLLSTDGSSHSTASGSVRVLPSQGDPIPLASATFSLRNATGDITTAAAVLTQPPTELTMLFAEKSGGFSDRIPGVRSAIALTNTSNFTARLKIELFNAAGRLAASSFLSVPPNAQVSRFLHQLENMDSIPEGPGTLVISSENGAKISATALRARYTKTGNFLITSLPTSQQRHAVGEELLVLSHVAVGQGYQTELILMSDDDSKVRIQTIWD